MIYSKFSGTQTGGSNLLTIIQGIVVNFGWTVEFYGDNIIDSINLGKKLIIKKDNIYYYLAASDNNNPTGNNADFVNNNISCLKAAQGLTLNTTNSWFNNNLSNTSANSIPGCEYKPSTNYTLYINEDNLILINTFQVGMYSSLIIGRMKKLGQNDNITICFGSNESNNGLVSNSRLAQRPFLELKTTLGSIIKGPTGLAPGNLRQNNFESFTGNWNYQYLSYLTSRTSVVNDQLGDMNKGFSSELGLTYTFDYVGYYTDGFNYKRLFTYDELRIVNMNLIANAGDQLPEGDNIYEVWPFFKKEVPQSYENNESWGLGFAVKVAGV